MKTTKLTVVLAIMISACSAPQKESEVDFASQVDEVMTLGSKQYEYMASQLQAEEFPTSYQNGKLNSSGSGWWCSGFYPGSLWYLFEQTKDSSLYEEVTQKLAVLEKEQYNTSTHDLGFMIHCSFGNAYRITGNEDYKQVIYEAAKSLSSRFNPTVGCIRSWDPAPWNDKWQYPVIIDNMMNLEMLLWAAREFNDTTFSYIAKTHANTTLKNHFREDYSSYHVVSYDTLTGDVEMKNTDQGYADESPWARGQMWGLYGYTVMYRFTKDPAYLKQAEGIAHFLINHPNFPKDKIPYWDFDAPDIPNAKRDASAAAIMASGLLELSQYADESNSSSYINTAEAILKSLSSPAYLAKEGTNGGFILMHSVGNMPDNSEVDVPLSYADYYYLEALSRYKTLKN